MNVMNSAVALACVSYWWEVLWEQQSLCSCRLLGWCDALASILADHKYLPNAPAWEAPLTTGIRMPNVLAT